MWRLGEQVRCREGFCEISTAAGFLVSLPEYSTALLLDMKPLCGLYFWLVNLLKRAVQLWEAKRKLEPRSSRVSKNHVMRRATNRTASEPQKCRISRAQESGRCMLRTGLGISDGCNLCEVCHVPGREELPG